MTDKNLMRRIQLGEDSTLELKSVLLSGDIVKGPKRDDFANELVALANSRGGTMVLGVDDKTRRVEGIPLHNLDAVEGWVREICSDSVRPPLNVHLHKVDLKNADGEIVPVVRVDVDGSLFVHEGPGGYFHRIGSSKGSSTRKMAPDILARLFQERSQSRVIRFDESIVPATAPSDLQYLLAWRFFRDDPTAPLLMSSTLRYASCGLLLREPLCPPPSKSSALRIPGNWLAAALPAVNGRRMQERETGFAL